MNIIFMGTPDFAVPSLRALLEEGYNVTTVVTQPDRPKGRKRVLTPPPVKVEAEKHGIPVLQPEKLRQADSVEVLRGLQPDLIVTAAYGQILPKAVLDLPAHGCINIHASLLPKYRGGAPIHHAVLRGESVTGVTIMYMATGLDTGDMISKVELPIEDTDTTGTLFEKLSIAGADLLKRTLPDLLAGRIQAVPQNEAEAIYSPNIRREDELIDWSRSAVEIWNQVRGLNPFPGAYTLWNGEVMKVWASANPRHTAEPRSRSFAGSPAPGTVLGSSEQGIEVMTGEGTLWLTEIQPAGKKAMPVSEFVRGVQIAPGTAFGSAKEATT
ncbi:methionyl-tRNA formyltransferase [Paenibacillus sp. GCM10023248]|uniref:methionyl-tRNA formyltransferase n=1 Tax=Bacillales TaxID=1385 RepID=UPI002379A6E0|nr:MULTISPECIES: methionyl-tRNA formyltransferase [Bacillales]MDD9270181.1 methionyl-tRNA formyltransferase [Paenibacillus sp. MAHUQ-63]MDR6880316.1 methionyl-tRNA formyltransferase [Bacillus sp. 3255]